MRNIVKRIDHPNGACRLEIFQNPNGTFTFDQFLFDERKRVFFPVSTGGRSLPRTASAEEALAEAKGRIAWLSEL
jgi:hypothetical protein